MPLQSVTSLPRALGLPSSWAFKALLVATVLIAACAIPQRASAQNGLEKQASSKAVLAADISARDASERAERERISQERKRAGAAHEAAKTTCYQRFDVNQCLMQARDVHNQQLSDLKRQEISLSDMQRKRRGAEQALRTEEKSSPKRQEQQAQRRGKAIAEEARRKERQKLPTESAADAPADPSADVRATAAANAAASAAGPRIRLSSQLADKQQKDAQAAKAKLRYEQRIQEAEQHRANVEKRQQKATKPPAATLPTPPG